MTHSEINHLPAQTVDPALLLALIDSAHDAIISKNLDSIITSWNKSAERIFGYEAHEIIGQSVLLLIPPELQSEEQVIIGKIRSGQKIEHYETVRRRKDGTLIDISLTVSPIKGPDGEIIGASKIVREITDLKQAREKLHASQESYRTLFNSLDESFCTIQMIYNASGEPVDWRYLEVNPAFEEHNGLVDAVGKTARELLPGLEERWFQLYSRVALTGEPIRTVEGSEALNRWFDVYAFRVGEPEERKVAVLFNNITEQKQAEEAVRESEEKYRLLWRTATDAFVLFDSDNTILEANAATAAIFGYQPEEVIGQDISMLQPERLREGHRQGIRRYLETGVRKVNWRAAEAVGLHKDGYEVPLEIAFNHLHQHGRDLFAGFIRDITERKQIEAEREALLESERSARDEAEIANRAKDEFLATLSHELRTPLNAVLGWSRMLDDDRLDEEDRAQAIQAIQRNAQLQVQLIEDILDVSRIISGKLRLEVRPTELTTVIEEAVASVLPAAQAKDIRLQRVLESSISLVSGDPNRLQQVVWNLLSNAIKFTPKGGRVQVRLERVNSHIEIIVTDTGVGIPSSVLPHVFERFRQADSTSTRQHGGLGLGLAIVKHLVEMHGGTVEAESGGEGKGSTFTVKLPLIAARSAELDTDKSEERMHPTASRGADFDCPPELEGLRVLVVDDEDDARHLIRAVLERCRATVTTATNAAEALQLLQASPPDVLVSDLGMPGEDGYSLIKKVRSLPREQRGQTPAAALTAYARVEDRMRVLRSGFQIHLPKPVEPAELVAVVANLAGRSLHSSD